MAIAEYSYTIELKEAHLKWGEKRYTDSRTPRMGEGYIPIPADVAYAQNLLNENATNGKDIIGQNIFYCTSQDGFFNNVAMKSQGNQNDANYAKQFSVNDSLQTMGAWYQHVNAQVGDHVKITWTSPTEILIEKI